MSSVRFLTVDGKRVDVTDMREEWEYRCDSCGEFVASDEMISVQGQVFRAGRDTDHFRMDLHRACAEGELPWLKSSL